MTSDHLLASNACLKELEAEGKLVQERMQEIKDLSSHLSSMDVELKLRGKIVGEAVDVGTGKVGRGRQTKD